MSSKGSCPTWTWPWAESAVLRLWIAKAQCAGLDYPLIAEPFTIVLPAVVGTFDDAGLCKGCRVRPGESSVLEFLDPGVVIRSIHVAEKAVHLDRAGLLPIPGTRLSWRFIENECIGIEVAVCRDRGAIEWKTGMAEASGAASHMSLSQKANPVGDAKVEALITGRGEVSIVQGIPAAERAGAEIPGPTSVDETDSGPFIISKPHVETVGLDIGRVMTAGAGFHR